jgi:hypothetical protein
MVAGALALRKDCAGVIWNEVPRLVGVETARRAAGRLGKGRDPLTFWVAMTGTDRPAPKGGAVTLHETRTAGLAPFFGCEIEIAPEPVGGEVQERVLGGVLAHVFAEGAMVEDGAAFRIEGAGTYLAHLEAPDTDEAPGICRLSGMDSPAEPEEDDAPFESAFPLAGSPSGSSSLPGEAPEPQEFEPSELEPPEFASADLEPVVEEDDRSGPAGPGAQDCTAIILFAPDAAPDAAALSRAILRQTRRMGSEPALDAGEAHRLVLDWGSIRGLGERRTEVVHSGWSLPADLAAFLIAENPDVVVRDPELLSRSVAVLVRDLPPGPVPEPSVPAAMLLAHVASAIAAMPGARGIVWPSSGVLLGRDAALPIFRRMGAELPIGLCVARLVLDTREGRVLVTRGLSDLGETEVMMMCDDVEDRQLLGAFDALVRAVLQRSLTRRGDRFQNPIDGAEYELAKDEVEGAGPVLRARLMRPPKGMIGLQRLLRRLE